MKVQTHEKREDSGTVKIIFDGDVTIYTVSNLKKDLMKKCDKNRNMEFDFSGITKIDTAGYQVLFLFKKDAEKKGGSINFTNPSDEVKNVFSLYGETFQ